MNDEFERYLVFAGSYNIFRYYLKDKNKEDRNKYSYKHDHNSIASFNKVGIILLYEWDRENFVAKYNSITTLLFRGSRGSSKAIGERESISDELWTIFEEIQNPPKYTKYNRFEIIDV